MEQDKRRSLQRLERQMEKLKIEIEEIKKKTFNSAFFINNPKEASELHTKLENLKEELERKEDSWLRAGM